MISLGRRTGLSIPRNLLGGSTTSRCLSSLRTEFRPTVIKSNTVFQFQNAPFTQTRGLGFKRIEVKSPLGIKLLRYSRVIGLTILAAYAIGGSVFTFMYLRETSKSDTVQKIPQDWSFQIKSLVRDAVNNELDNKYDRALQIYKLAVDQLTTTEGQDGNRVPVTNLGQMSPEWLAGYSDVLIRYARLLELNDQSEEAKAALLASEQIPWGSPDLKSIGAIQLAKYALADGDKHLAEEYFINSVKAVATPSMAAYFNEGPDQDLRKAVLIPDALKEQSSSALAPVNSNDGKPTGEGVSIQLYNATIELAKYYALVGSYTRAMEILLSTLRSVRRKREPEGRSSARIPDAECLEARSMSYISEVFWAADKAKRKEAVTWAEGAFHEAYPLSNSTVECGLCAIMVLENLIKMYKSLGMPDEAERCKAKLEDVHAPMTNYDVKGWSFIDMITTNRSR